MSTNTQTPSNNVDEVLNETEIGSFIAKNKGFVIGAVIGVLLAIIAHGFYKQSEEKTNDEYNKVIFNFKETSLQDYKDKKTKGADVLAALGSVSSQVGVYKGANLLYFTVSDEMVAQKDYESALKALEMVQSPGDAYSTYFLASRKAMVLEDLNRPAEALAVLEGLGDASKKLLEGKYYLDMGRLQMKTGDKVRAKVSFQYLQDKIVQEEFSKMAKYYLYQIEKEEAPQATPAVEMK